MDGRGVALSLCVAGLLGVFDPEDKMERGPYFSISVQDPGSVLTLPGAISSQSSSQPGGLQ